MLGSRRKLASGLARSISGVVEYIVAIDVTRARFPADALLGEEKEQSRGSKICGGCAIDVNRRLGCRDAVHLKLGLAISLLLRLCVFCP